MITEEKINEERINKINWDLFERDTDYVELETGKAKKLVLANWQEDTTFERLGIRFTVVEEDGRKLKIEKVFVTRSVRLIRKLIPLIKYAEKQNENCIKVSILKTGEGFDIKYSVEDLSSKKKSQYKGK